MTDKSPSEQANDLVAKWNPPPVDHMLERVVGVPTDPADVAATAHAPLDQGLTPQDDSVDAQRQFADDLDDEDEGSESYDDMTNEQLREELGKRDLPKSGNKAEMVARLQESDAAADDDEDDDDEDE